MYRVREEWQLRTAHTSAFENGVVWDELSDLRDGPGNFKRWQQGNITKIVWLCWAEDFEKLDYNIYKSKAKIGLFFFFFFKNNFIHDTY